MAPIISRISQSFGFGKRTPVVTTAAAGIVATGGTKTTSGLYTIHVFTASGSLDVTSGSGTIDYLVVAGGGGSGPDNSGGAGAGGMLTGTNTLVPGPYTVTIGAGGPFHPGAVPARPTGKGSDSVFAPGTPIVLTATGGGYGGSPDGAPGGPGGSGGGGCYGGGGGGAGTPGQGNPGGTAITDSAVTGAGGGGAGGAGGNIPSVGADGLPVSWIPAAYGTPGPAPGRYFAGGGGGSTRGPSPYAGGAGGGGSGSNPTPNAAQNGTFATGGGAGGCGNGQPVTKTSGGSGIIAIRYLT